jgi:hypothetical protein
MSFQKFSRKQYVVPVDTGVEGDLGSYTLQAATELKHVLLTIYKHGTLSSGNDRGRVKIYGSEARDVALYTSDWSDFADISGLGTYWLGAVRFDFSQQNLAPREYWLGLELGNYTRSADIRFIGFVLDWPYPINTQLATMNSAAVRFVGYV